MPFQIVKLDEVTNSKGAEIKWKSHSSLHEIVEMNGRTGGSCYPWLTASF